MSVISDEGKKMTTSEAIAFISTATRLLHGCNTLDIKETPSQFLVASEEEKRGDAIEPCYRRVDLTRFGLYCQQIYIKSVCHLASMLWVLLSTLSTKESRTIQCIPDIVGFIVYSRDDYNPICRITDEPSRFRPSDQ